MEWLTTDRLQSIALVAVSISIIIHSYRIAEINRRLMIVNALTRGMRLYR